MNAKLIWAHFGLVALFAGGVAAGILFHHQAMPPHSEMTPSPGDHPTNRHDATHFAEYFSRRLDLTDEQAAEVQDVLDRLHGEMRGVANEFHERFETARSRAWTDIRAALTEEQIPEFESLVEEMESEHSLTGREHALPGDRETRPEEDPDNSGDHDGRDHSRGEHDH